MSKQSFDVIASRAQELHGQVRNILMIEDSKLISSFIKRNLEETQIFSVTVCHTLAEAQQTIKKHGADFFAALLDLNLPDASDGEAVDLAMEYGIPSIVLTSLIDDKLRERVESQGVIDYVLKSRDATSQVLEILIRLIKNRDVTILVVDDSSLMRRVMRDYLSRFGFQVLEAVNGKKALETLEQNPEIPLVITDYEMPEMGGAELCEAIRETKRKTELAIIGVSSHENKLLSAKLIKAGANDFLTKPFQREELYTRIVQNLENLEYIERINTSLTTISNMHQRMKRDLDAAAKLQRSLLPNELPVVEGLQLASLFSPCDELAGDTYNCLVFDERHVGIFVVDVSGHGVPSALLSVTLSRLLKARPSESTLLVEHGDGDSPVILPPGEVCRRLNTQFPMDPENFQYFTIVYGILDRTAMTFTYSSAGHPGPIHVRPGKGAKAHKPLSMAIGFSPETEFKEEVIKLAPGDRIFFYTDGLVEAMNESGEEFGTDRLRKLFGALVKHELEATLQRVYNCVDEWNATNFKDDVTICAVACV